MQGSPRSTCSLLNALRLKGPKKRKGKGEKARGVASGDATAASAPPLKGAGGIAKAPAFRKRGTRLELHTENLNPLNTDFKAIFPEISKLSPNSTVEVKIKMGFATGWQAANKIGFLNL
jgi:hypothetical protein